MYKNYIMNKAVLLLCSLLLLVLSANVSMAQDYKSAVGLKFGGYENGISLKYFINSFAAL